jgi:GTP-binding protein YchF
MGLSCGIVGLPNVGKSTLFNALTSTIQAEAANYPFCTIEPNKGIVGVPDDRLAVLSKIAKSQKVIPTQIEFVDIAGLVKGASKGDGLGNQFLSNIRETDAIIHVLRCFDDDDITHVEGSVDPLRDLEIINTELVLADLESVEKRLPNLEKRINTGKKEFVAEFELLKIVLRVLEQGRFASEVLSQGVDPNELRKLNLISSKPVLYVCNVSENEAATGNGYSQQIIDFAQKTGHYAVIISSKIEEDIAVLQDVEEKKAFLQEIGLQETGLSKIIKTAYSILGLITFFTIGEKEARAWTVKKGAKAPNAAGEIHTDFEKGFIRAEVIAYNDYVLYNGEAGSKENGKMRLEGKDYIVADGDVMHFRFNV